MANLSDYHAGYAEETEGFINSYLSGDRDYSYSSLNVILPTVDDWPAGSNCRWVQREFVKATGADRLPQEWMDAIYEISGKAGPIIRRLFAYKSLTFPGQIAFTPDSKYGVADRQVTMKPGRFLAKYVSESLSSEQIACLANKFVTLSRPLELKLAVTADDIERVYLNGPSSCMSHDENYYQTGGVHPVRAYAAGDLAVAYVEREGRIISRAVVWPERKIHLSIYGNIDALAAVLEKEGYSRDDDFSGAKLRLIPIDTNSSDCRSFVLPYLDTDDKFVKEREDCLVISYCGVPASFTTGRVVVWEIGCDQCEDCPEPSGSEDGADFHFIDDMTLCDDCYSDMWRCKVCDGIQSGREGNNSVCESCYDERWVCKKCDDEFFSDADLSELPFTCNRCFGLIEVIMEQLNRCVRKTGRGVSV